MHVCRKFTIAQNDLCWVLDGSRSELTCSNQIEWLFGFVFWGFKIENRKSIHNLTISDLFLLNEAKPRNFLFWGITDQVTVNGRCTFDKPVTH